jgi:threonylcarbamoyladenosine tRNA methylthiotransferase MtaB
VEVSSFRFAIAVLGCRANQEEADSLRSVLLAAGGREVPYPGPADLVLVNTCAVTASAQAQSRQEIRKAGRRRARGVLIVTGCGAQIEPAHLAQLPGVDLVLGNRAKARLPSILGHLLGHKNRAGHPPFPRSAGPRRQAIDDALAAAQLTAQGAASGGRIGWSADPTPERFLRREGPIPERRSRPGLKIQDGCHLRCSYCIVSHLRGAPRSRSGAEVVREARRLTSAGFREIVLTGINLGLYGQEVSAPEQPAAAAGPLSALLHELCSIEGLARVRLSSLEPMTLRTELLETIGALPKVARHLHIAFQSGDDEVLRAMRRPYTAADLAALAEQVTAHIPGCALGVDVLAGFPGESDAAFARTLELLERLEVSYIHAFGYSERPGTAAADLGGRVPPALRKERVRALGELDGRLRLRFQRRLRGKRCDLVVERVAGARFEGLSGEYVRMCGEAPGRVRGEWLPVIAGSSRSAGLQACRVLNSGPPSGP